jgi:8-oxo-dGTP pyrophosphatase MutT (NUDIX family)
VEVLDRERVDAEALLGEAPALASEVVAELRGAYGDVEVNAEREWLPADRHDPDATAPEDLYRYASVWCRRDDEVLLVQPSVDEGWCGPGGTRESGESLAGTARRETHEETGIDVQVTGVLEVRLAWTGFAERVEGAGGGREPDLQPREDLPGGYSLGAIFHAEPVGGDLRPEPGEIDAVGWFSEVPERRDLVFDRVAGYPL